jgi:ketosteroid isomerase-like protein
MTRDKISFLVFLTAFLPGCATDPVPAANPEVLMEADRAFAEATAKQGTEGWVSHFAETGTMFRDGEIVRGHESIRTLMDPAFATEGSGIAWEPTEAEIAASGDLGYTIGRFESTVIGPNGGRQTRTGSYVTIWKKQGDGTWKVAVDIGSNNVPER